MTSTLLEAAAPVVQCKETLQAAAQVNLILAFHRLPDGVVAEVFQGDFIRRKLGCLHLDIDNIFPRGCREASQTVNGRGRGLSPTYG